MRFGLVRGRRAAVCAAIGSAGAAIFLFAFPKGSISTLMHAVLHLPGPGVGIALVLGPFLTLVTLVASLLSRRDGGALLASLAFALVYALVVCLLGIPTSQKGAFGSMWFIAAVTVLGMAAEAVMMLCKSLRESWRCVLAGALANAFLLVFYWIAIFPRTVRWVDWADVPVLLGLCLAGGLAAGHIAWAASRPVSRAFTFE